MNKTVAATTIGCKVNLYDTQGILEYFTKVGYSTVDFGEKADVYVVNTCSVTNLADKKSRQMIRQAKRRNPDAIVAAVGCSTQSNPSIYEGLGVDIIMGTANRDKLVEHVENFNKQIVIDLPPNIRNEQTFENAEITTDTELTRAFLKIQDGCNNFCTYCIIPHVRGASRSRNFGDLLAQAQGFAHKGYKEIVVAGIHVASYGKDLHGHNLIDALSTIAEISGIERVRLSSVEPNVITPEFCDFVAKTPKFCDHLHLSLQSGSDRILQLMNRKYTTENYRQAVAQIRAVRPKISITTDVIAGFPGETDQDHRQTLDFVEELKLAKIHVFPFSAKEGTVAAGLSGQIPRNVKKQRSAEILEVSNKLEMAYYQGFIGQTMPVLVEEINKNGFYSGKTSNYMSVEFISTSTDLTNRISPVKLNLADNNRLFGTLE
ncbi:MAG: tRNA (N(6)-L-threonylcarbamoyladenosine(37)-C(2))-methylthiotransferase MtaB [Defluviitaleaceae bacterium]|nr:tRNA (N(6)-L-threonylcarbamoyladenosine(37)-C(2))-methylthiotransferase MtaB [Defluviitaleaceae bacterium]